MTRTIYLAAVVTLIMSVVKVWMGPKLRMLKTFGAETTTVEETINPL